MTARVIIISSYLDSPQVDVFQQAQRLHLGFHMDAHVLDVFDFLALRVVRNNKQVLLLFFFLLDQLPGHDPGSEGISPHLLVVDPDRKVDNFTSHVVLNCLRCPVVIGQSSPGPEVGDKTFSEDVEPLVESCEISLSDIQFL